MSTNYTDKQAMVARLAKLGAERTEKLIKLQRSLAIQHIWPEAFDYGTVKSYWYGNPCKGLKFKIIRRDGSFREFEPGDLPPELRETMPGEPA